MSLLHYTHSHSLCHSYNTLYTHHTNLHSFPTRRSSDLDMIFASENARMGLPEVTLGITPGFGGTQRLVRLVGKLRAKEIIFTGEMVDARQAAQIGLVNAVFPREELLPHCRKIGAKIATRGPLAVARAKRL